MPRIPNFELEKENVMLVRRSRLLVVLLSLSLLSVPLLTVACHHGVPKRDTVVNIRALTTALGGLQASETAIFNAHTVPALTLDKHKAFNAKVVEIVDATSAALDVVDAWRPGQPVPTQLAPILTKTKALLTEGAAVIGAALPKEFATVWDALTQIAFIVGGVL
jgi:hypothetical protein